LWVFVLFLTACSSLSPASPSPGNLVNVGGYEMYLHCIGTGTPTVVMEAGFNDVAETWSLVQPEVANFTRVCAYDRAGLGKSDSGSEPRDSYQIIKELHNLLNKAGFEGPYVLVGHSLGGIYMRLFADYYPAEVVGLVLVDSAHIDDPNRCKEVLPPESLNESESLRSIREYLANPLTFPEIPERIFTPGSLGDMPLVVLSVPKQQRSDDLPAEFRDALDKIWVDLQEEWALISTRSTHILVYESSHFIQKDQPDQVIDAIKQVVEDVRLDSQ
jgi:pimeloyl-ACP methyl ester carboxylesterase